jgi:beta-galactosidase
VAWDQLALPVSDRGGSDVPKVLPPVRLDETPDAATITGEGFRVRVGKASGAIESLVYREREHIAAPLVPNFWRAPTDNDRGNGMPRRLAVWRGASAGRKVTAFKAAKEAPALARVTVAGTLDAKDSKFGVEYTVDGAGVVGVTLSIEPAAGLPEIPRVGMQMAMPVAFDRMTWLGRGPHESYWDRKTGAAVGLYSGSVNDLVHDYVRPQENGNRADVRWVAFTDAEGNGLMASGSDGVSGGKRALLNASAWPYTQEDLEKARHTSDLPQRAANTVNLDHLQMGVGGDDSWGAPVHKEYLIPATKHSYSFVLRPVTRKWCQD